MRARVHTHMYYPCLFILHLVRSYLYVRALLILFSSVGLALSVTPPLWDPCRLSLNLLPSPCVFFWVLLFSFTSNAGWFAGQCMCGWQYFRYFWELDSGELTDENAYIALSLRVPNTHGQTHKHRDTSAHTHILAHSNARAKHATCTIHFLILPPLLHPALTKKIKKYENNAFRHCFYFCLHLCVYVCECVRV